VLRILCGNHWELNPLKLPATASNGIDLASLVGNGSAFNTVMSVGFEE
jgi:hypothetical protein